MVPLENFTFEDESKALIGGNIKLKSVMGAFALFPPLQHSRLTRSKVTTVNTFSYQNGAGSCALTT